MRLIIKYPVLILILLIAISCNTNKRISAPRNLERIYDPSSSTLHPKIKIYSNSDTSSVIVEYLKTKELLFNQNNPGNKLLSKVQIVYNLYDLSDKLNLVDSSTITFKFDKDPKKQYEAVEIEVNSQKGGNYLLEIITTDINRKNSHYSFYRINRTQENNLQDFYYYNKANNEIIVDSYIRPKLRFGIKHFKREIDSMYVYFFKDDFYTSLPPYMEDTLIDNNQLADTVWVSYLDSINYENFKVEGLYYFSEKKLESNYNNGVALFNYGEKFPVIRTPKELVQPIKYLGNIDSIPGSDSTGKLTKLAVDDFWLAKANNIDKSRELLIAYYNRVMLANKYFTSYKEGWKTDRGMIYIIYGLPDYLFKSGDEERWIYNPEGISTGITFIFNYEENPFTFNHYVLDREKLKYTGWDNAVEMWNKGEIIYFQTRLE